MIFLEQPPHNNTLKTYKFYLSMALSLSFISFSIFKYKKYKKIKNFTI